MMVDALKPCPFCGGKARLMRRVAEYLVKCTGCGTTGKSKQIAEFAVKAWNRRAEQNE